MVKKRRSLTEEDTIGGHVGKVGTALVCELEPAVCDRKSIDNRTSIATIRFSLLPYRLYHLFASLNANAKQDAQYSLPA